MARQPRLHVPGGFYHVTLRGNHRQAIFFSESDRNTLDWLVAEALTRYAARLHAFCWMTNHLHLLVQISDIPLGRLIFLIASRYARRIQAGFDTTGHLFERRYHAILVDADAYLLTLIRYIHLNPVRAGIAQFPGDYPWSSHRDYLGLCARPWVETDFALTLLAQDRPAARLKYDFMMRQSPDVEWGTGALRPNPKNAFVLGDDWFVARTVKTVPPVRVTRTVATILNECCDSFSVTPELLASPSKARPLCRARAWFANEAVSSGAATVSTVARQLERSETAIRTLLARHSRQASNVRNV